MKAWIIAGAVALVAIVYFSTAVSYRNRERSLRADFEAEQRANQADFDNMYKTIAQKYQVTGDFTQALKELTAATIAGREGGAAVKAVSEAYPNLDANVFREMMATIEGKRNQFQSRQLRLSDIAAQHKKLIINFPGSWFISGATPLEVKLITSGRTERVFESGQDNDIDLRGPATRSR